MRGIWMRDDDDWNFAKISLDYDMYTSPALSGADEPEALHIL
jgi:hypothetical protein